MSDVNGVCVGDRMKLSQTNVSSGEATIYASPVDWEVMAIEPTEKDGQLAAVHGYRGPTPIWSGRLARAGPLCLNRPTDSPRSPWMTDLPRRSGLGYDRKGVEDDRPSSFSGGRARHDCHRAARRRRGFGGDLADLQRGRDRGGRDPARRDVRRRRDRRAPATSLPGRRLWATRRSAPTRRRRRRSPADRLPRCPSPPALAPRSRERSPAARSPRSGALVECCVREPGLLRLGQPGPGERRLDRDGSLPGVADALPRHALRAVHHLAATVTGAPGLSVSL